MKKLLLLALFVAGAASAKGVRRTYVNDQNCQVTVNENNNTDGLIKCMWPSGKVKFIGHNDDGKRDGETRYWDESGKLLEYKNYKNGLQEGTAQVYDPKTDMLSEELSYVADKKHGVCNQYYGGKLDVLDGTSRTYYKNGREHETLSYAAGLLRHRRVLGENGQVSEDVELNPDGSRKK